VLSAGLKSGSFHTVFGGVGVRVGATFVPRRSPGKVKLRKMAPVEAAIACEQAGASDQCVCEVANPDGCEWSVYEGPLFIDFRLPAAWRIEDDRLGEPGTGRRQHKRPLWLT
jgi:hypothetical protein